ncbi:hypothetical protein BX666DRAFT_565525 [Dichotomocladium elegans]|nr:hypothetical protein BX666DRAFT_565525 [Dichotomocladium elegans]
MATRDRQPLDADRIKVLKQKRRAKKKARKQRHQDLSLETNAKKTPKESGSDSPNDIDSANIYYTDNSIHAALEYSSREWQELIPVLDHFTWSSQNQPVLQADRSLSYSANNTQQPTVVSDCEQERQPSRKKLKRLAQLTLEELKQIADVPEVVEPWDVTAADPELLVSLKGYRNTVPVPRHWCRKYAYLHHRKDRPAWQLPDYIAQTGIADTRDAMRQKEARASARRRARLNPKLGKMDIDYQKLHDAFFKYPIHVRISRHGELYYEGKEWNDYYQPGVLSETLRTALGMDNNADSPPPWLYSMQRHGPPPGHMRLLLPGVNAPAPKGAPLGYQRGGWGAPPPPLPTEHNRDDEDNEPIDKRLWGELLDNEYGLAREEQLSDRSDEDEAKEIMSIEDEPIAEYDVPEAIELRKTRPATSSSQGTSLGQELPLYHVLTPSVNPSLNEFLPSEHIYNIPASKDVDVAVHDPSELEDTSLLMSKYEDAQDALPSSRPPQPSQSRIDVSDMLLKHVQLQAKRRKQQDRYKQSKKKDFRF